MDTVNCLIDMRPARAADCRRVAEPREVMPMAASILWPMLAHFALVCLLYAWLTVARLRAVRRGEVDFACFVTGREEPLAIARITRNLANQFELPAMFYALVVLLVALGRVT